MPALERATAIAGRFASGSGASAAPAWAQLEASEQDALTATLARLLMRFDALEPVYVARSDGQSYEIALHRLRAATHADCMFAAIAGLLGGTGLPGELSVRDYCMAESVRWHLKPSDPDTRIVLVCHNNHIQRTPVVFSNRFTNVPMGEYLARAFGDRYYALALTSTDDHVPDMQLDETSPAGFKIVDTPLDSPEPGSIEAAALNASLSLGLIDLRRVRTELTQPEAVSKIRKESSYMDAPVLDAIDSLVVLPTVTVEHPPGM